MRNYLAEVMSIRLGVNPISKLILISIAARANESGQAEVSMSTLAAESLASENGVRNMVKQLVKTRHITVTTGGGRLRNTYTLFPPCDRNYSQLLEKVNQRRKKDGRGFLYLMVNRTNGYHKLGHSFNPVPRERTLQAEEPMIQLLKIWPGTQKDELELHSRFAASRIRGEWFQLTQEQIEQLGTVIQNIQEGE